MVADGRADNQPADGGAYSGASLIEGTAPSSLRENILRGKTADASAFFEQDRAALTRWLGKDQAQRIAASPDRTERVRAAIDRDIATIDALISQQIDAVLHKPQFQQLEGRWRGLRWMAAAAPRNPRIRIRVLPVRWAEIARDLEQAIEFDQSSLFRHIYENEFGMAGGEPFGLLLVDHEVRHMPAPRAPGAGKPVDDVATLTQLAAIGAAAFAPIVIGVSPGLLGVDDFGELARAGEPVGIMRGQEYARWRQMMRKPEMRFVAAVLPRVLARRPWRPDPQRRDGFRYRERTPDAQSRTWSTACYAFAIAVLRAQDRWGWPAEIRGATPGEIGGGLIDDLVAEPFVLGAETRWDRAPLDIVLTDTQEQAIAQAGFIPLNEVGGGARCAFSAVPSLHVPDAEDATPGGAIAAANRHLSTQVNAMLCVSRFAHVIKILGRRFTGSFATAEETERRLQKWLSQYVNGSVTAQLESRARHPLTSGRVTVTDPADRPGHYQCVIHLQPHYQLDDIGASFRLVTELGARAA